MNIAENCNLRNSGSRASGRSPVWLGHQPPTLTTRVQIPATAPNASEESPFDFMRALSGKNRVIGLGYDIF
jgi:hypothetical protein